MAWRQACHGFRSGCPAGRPKSSGFATELLKFLQVFRSQREVRARSSLMLAVRVLLSRKEEDTMHRLKFCVGRDGGGRIARGERGGARGARGGRVSAGRVRAGRVRGRGASGSTGISLEAPSTDGLQARTYVVLPRRSGCQSRAARHDLLQGRPGRRALPADRADVPRRIRGTSSTPRRTGRSS